MNKLTIDSFENFSESYDVIAQIRKSTLEKGIDSQIKSDIFKHGCGRIKNAFNLSDLHELMNFQQHIEKLLNNRLDCSGYVNCSGLDASTNLPYMAQFNPLLPNHGQMRIQTKSLPFQMPGFLKIAHHKILKDVFSWWHEDEGTVTRGTMEWIVPAPLNHNGWHKDTFAPQLKCFVLLGPVDLETAPMYFAKGSHFHASHYEKEVVYRMIKKNLKIDNTIYRKGNHYPAVAGSHGGYVGDDEAVNDSRVIDDSPVKIGPNTYEKMVCTGDIGDIIFFESCGFHSGNFSNGKIRRTISMSSHDNKSSIALALENSGIGRL